MGGRKKRSKQQSSTSPSEPHESIVIFVEASIGSKKVCDRLREIGATVKILTDHFKEDEKDTVWLRHAGTSGWAVLMKDEAIRRRAIELDALIQGKVAAFAFANGNLSGELMADAVAKAFEKMKRFVKRYEPPFIAKIYQDGHVSMWFDSEELPKILEKLLRADQIRQLRHFQSQP